MEHLSTLELADLALNELRELYLRDTRPWVVGFSGGKDSSCVVQLVFRMLFELPADRRHKTVHVIASDTLVESPVVEKFLDTTFASMLAGVKQHQLPMVIAKVSPEMNDSFWVNLLGKGYPAPNRFFRWCTERLKIDPATRYIQKQINEWGEAIILLGARKDESSSRAQVLENHRTSDGLLRKHATMPQAYVYAPISDWKADDVWSYLIAYPTPWDPRSGLNSTLRNLYRDANSGECPLVIDTTTPSCGQSRFGCWVCTVITNDNSMEGFLDTGGEQYEWMAPLNRFRNKLKLYRDQPSKREPWRRKGQEYVENRWAFEEAGQIRLPMADEPGVEDTSTTLGPLKLEVRQELLKELLEIQKETGHQLIQDEELDLIRRHWTEDYRVSPLAMYDILEEVYGPAARREQKQLERQLLEKTCDDTGVDVLALDRLLDLERGYVTKLRRRGIVQAVDTLITELVKVEGKSDADSQSDPT